MEVASRLLEYGTNWSGYDKKYIKDSLVIAQVEYVHFQASA